MYRTLELEIKGAVATVTLNRPEARNAMSAALMREMIACAGRVAALRGVDVAIVRGSGKWFSAGADLNDASRWGNAARPLDEQREIAAQVRTPRAHVSRTVACAAAKRATGTRYGEQLT